MKKAEKEPAETKTAPLKGGRKTDPLTPEELREMYIMVKEIHHHLGLDGAAIRSLRDYVEMLLKHGFRIGMSRKGTPTTERPPGASSKPIILRRYFVLLCSKIFRSDPIRKNGFIDLVFLQKWVFY